MDNQDKVQDAVDDTTTSAGDDTSSQAGDDTQKVDDTQQQALTEERVTQLVAEEMEKARRQFQSEKDRAIAQINREADTRVRRAETLSSAYEQNLGELDEDVRGKLETAKLQSQNQYYQQREQEDANMRAYRQTYDTFNSQMSQYVTGLGIDPNSLDWGDEAEPLLVKQQRILGDVGKKQKDIAKQSEDALTKKMEAMETKIRQDLGVDNVDTSSSAGVSSGDDAEFKKGLGDGSIPLNKTNMARAKKLGLA